MKRLIIYVHGKGGNAEEAKHYAPLFVNSKVIGFDYKSDNPWATKEEFLHFFERAREKYSRVTLIANSIGAFFSMSALSEKQVDDALMISPIVDMEKLICDMMKSANVSEEELFSKKEIPTAFGETLSWNYLRYVREHPIVWNVPTCILYGEKDSLTSLQTISDFAAMTGAELTVMKGGEHWFHTNKQMKFIDKWIADRVETNDDCDDETEELVSSMTLTGIL